MKKVSIKELRNYYKSKKLIYKLTIELTHKCTFRCSHCFFDDKLNGDYEISYESLTKLLQEAKKIGILFIELTGGEPLTHSKFVDIYVYLKKQGFIISLYTNLFLINNYLTIFSLHPPFVVEASIYGFDDFSYKQCTGVSAYNRVKKNLIILYKLNIPVMLKFLLTKNNYNQFVSGKQYVDLLQYCKGFSVSPYLYNAYNGKSRANLRITPQQAFDYLIKQDSTNFQGINYKNILRNSPKQYHCNNGMLNFYLDKNCKLKVCFKDLKFFDASNLCDMIRKVKKRKREIEELTQRSKCASCKFNYGCDFCVLELSDEEKNFMCELQKIFIKEVPQNV